MGDTYVECLVAREKNIGALILKGVVYGLAGVSMLIALLGFSVFFILGLALAAVGYFLCPCPDIEYEYLYLNKEMAIDKIMAKQKRKHIATYDLTKMEKMCPANSHELDGLKNRNPKVIDYSSRKEHAKVYTIVYRDDKEECLINIEPNEELCKVFKQAFPRKVIEY